METVLWTNKSDLPTQINTIFSRTNSAEMDEIDTWVEKLKTMLGSNLILIHVGRGKLNDPLSAKESESVFAKVYSMCMTATFHIKEIEAQHCRRFVLQQRGIECTSGVYTSNSHEISADAIGRTPRALLNGRQSQ